ncbi:MAG: hypothetical protein JXQ73_22040 [Phycisphaerae bacterium]|nr:hypothetical protein [Phycisphaerae bacterium]
MRSSDTRHSVSDEPEDRRASAAGGRGRMRRRLLLVVGAVVVAFGLAEVLVRCFVELHYFEPPEAVPRDAWRGMLHVASETPGLAYELAPNMVKSAHGVTVRTNAYGMRDGARDPDRPGSVFRIAAIGDSYTFGFGVEGEDAYPRQLERLLNRSHSGEGATYEVLNFGVGGYGARDEAVVLRRKAPAWKPNLVLVGYVLNDPELDPIQALHAQFHEPRWWQYSHVLRLIARSWYQVEKWRLGGGDYYRYLHAHPEKWGGVVQAFSDMRDEAERMHVGIVLLIFPVLPRDASRAYPYVDLHEKVAAAANERGLTVIDLRQAFCKGGVLDRSLFGGDGHPNGDGYAAAAQAIAAGLASRKLLPPGQQRQSASDGVFK